MVEHVYSVFALESENWSWIQKTLDRIQGREIMTMSRLFRFKREKEETWSDYQASVCRTDRKNGKNVFFFSVWCDRRKYVERHGMGLWRRIQCGDRHLETNFQMERRTKWRQSAQVSGMKEDPCNHTRWKHQLAWNNRGYVWDKLTTDWASKEDSMSKRKYYALDDKKLLHSYMIVWNSQRYTGKVREK